MISVDFTELNESLKTFILSVAIGSEKVIDSLLQTANRHLEQLERLDIGTPNFKLYFECSVSVLTQSYTVLAYINYHSADLFGDEHFSSLNPLDSDLRAIEKRFTDVLARFKKVGIR